MLLILEEQLLHHVVYVGVQVPVRPQVTVKHLMEQVLVHFQVQ